jgi:uncharacterized membrane protein YesL
MAEPEVAAGAVTDSSPVLDGPRAAGESAGTKDGLPAGPRPSLPRAVRAAALAGYDHLGGVLVVSLLWLALGVLPGAYGWSLLRTAPLLGVLLLAAWMLVCLPLAQAGLFTWARVVLAREEPSWLAFLRGARAGWGRFLGLGLVQIGITAILAADIAFFATRSEMVLRAIAGLFVWPALFWALALMLHGPLLTEQPGIRRTLRRGALFVFGHPLFTLGMGTLISVLTLPVLLLRPLAPLVVILPGALALLATSATRDLLRRYDLLPPEPELDTPVPDAPLRL